jgi:hypothetical protein
MTAFATLSRTSEPGMCMGVAFAEHYTVDQAKLRASAKQRLTEAGFAPLEYSKPII